MRDARSSLLTRAETLSAASAGGRSQTSPRHADITAIGSNSSGFIVSARLGIPRYPLATVTIRIFKGQVQPPRAEVAAQG